ncbi:MAG: riboflavin synthase [Bacteroidota bacterium]
MFTGIVEQTGKVIKIENDGTNRHFWISSSIASELRVDQSVAHNGVCLTVVEIVGKTYRVTAIEETLSRTNLKYFIENEIINIERCMPANGRFDGHIVQGHVDDTAFCKSIENKNGSWMFSFQIDDKKNTALIVEKGSICVNGISLTVASVTDNEFTVAIIPYTFEHTNMQFLKKSSIVNIEFDIIGKYISKIMHTYFQPTQNALQ